MKKMRRLGLNVLLIILISSCKEVTVWTIDDKTAEIVNPKDERISCYDERVREFACLTIDDLLRLKRKCSK